jgi:hypothetical protein
MPVVFDPFSFFTFAFLLSQDLSGSKVTSNQVHILLSLCLFKRKKRAALTKRSLWIGLVQVTFISLSKAASQGRPLQPV